MSSLFQTVFLESMHQLYQLLGTHLGTIHVVQMITPLPLILMGLLFSLLLLSASNGGCST
jgi:hypothetical protein